VSTSTFTIVQLYPEQLGVSGDGGNVVTLAERARRAGVDVTVEAHRPGDELPSTADLVTIGSGPLSTLRALHTDLLRFRSLLADWSDEGVPVLAIGGGMEILTRGIVGGEGGDIEGLGFFDATAHRGAKRRANYFQVETTYEGDDLTVLGFEDHATRIDRASGSPALGRVTHGGGNGDATEGILRGTSFGTQLKGPVLPLNPELADRLLRVALRRVGGTYAINDAHARLDEYARKSREVIVTNLERAFKAM
jgi:CobQ-like glutamine amidotransferase family enzyme